MVEKKKYGTKLIFDNSGALKAAQELRGTICEVHQTAKNLDSKSLGSFTEDLKRTNTQLDKTYKSFGQIANEAINAREGNKKAVKSTKDLADAYSNVAEEQEKKNKASQKGQKTQESFFKLFIRNPFRFVIYN